MITRQDAYSLMNQVIDAAKRLALAEKEYSDLQDRFVRLLHEGFPNVRDPQERQP